MVRDRLPRRERGEIVTAPFAERRVLVPVTEGRRDLSERLTALGCDVVEAECIAIAPPKDPAELEARVRRWCAGGYDWMAVTSRNAVLAMDRVARAEGLRLDSSRASVATVGEATTRVCSDVGLNVVLVPERADARGIVDAFPPGTGHVLVPMGNLAAPVVERGIAAKGWTVDVVEAYRTVDGPGLSHQATELLTAGEFDAVLLTSTSVAERIHRDLGGASIPARTAIVAIGRTTAAGARAVGLVPTIVADRPSHDGILEALAIALEEQS